MNSANKPPLVPQVDREILKPALKEFYQIHNASRISSIDTIVDSYAGREIELLEELRRRYKTEFEPFEKILREFKQSLLMSDNENDNSINVNVNINASRTKAEQTPVNSASSRSSILGLSDIQSLFSDKLMSGVGWKGFTVDTTQQDQKKDEQEIKEENTHLLVRHRNLIEILISRQVSDYLL
jgi:hypothetical protein